MLVAPNLNQNADVETGVSINEIADLDSPFTTELGMESKAMTVSVLVWFFLYFVIWFNWTVGYESLIY